eukprot:m.141655 g.141655  ORF g.141655 m.141655 type:complete len:511 (+) comp11563_c0_seq1:439-1971(+)
MIGNARVALVGRLVDARLVLKKRRLAWLGARAGEGAILEPFKVLAVELDAHHRLFVERHRVLLRGVSRARNAVVTDLPPLAVGVRNLAHTLFNRHRKDLRHRLVALEQARRERADKAVLAAEDELGAVDNLVVEDALGLVRGLGANGENVTIELLSEVLVVGARLEGNVGAEPLNLKLLRVASHLLGGALHGRVDDRPELAAAALDGPNVVADLANGLNLENFSVGRVRLRRRELNARLDRDLLAVGRRELDLRERVLHVEELVLGHRRLGRLARSAGTEGREKLVRRFRLKRHLASVKDNDKLARLVGGLHEGARRREERPLGRDETVRAVLGEKVHRNGCVIAPRNELVRAELAVGKVHIRLAVDVAEADLRVHGEVDGPHVLLLLLRLKGSPLDRRVVAAVPSVLLRLEAPAAIVLSFNENLCLIRLLFNVALEVTVPINVEVTVEVRLDVHVVLAFFLLKEPDLLLLHDICGSCNPESKCLGSEVLHRPIAEPKAPVKLFAGGSTN